jgi:L-histidine Nalpha-methyltransferase
MSLSATTQQCQFALDVAEGLSRAGQKKLAPRYFYDDLGSTLFEAITLLPEYGLTRADERLLCSHASELAIESGDISVVAELGSGSGKKTSHILRALAKQNDIVCYRPIDVSIAALALCEKELAPLAEVKPVCADWLDGLQEVTRSRAGEARLLVLFLGSSIGNFERTCITDFLRNLRSLLMPGDIFLLGADLVKDLETMITAYDDPTGITAAFNLNLLGRMNRELDADFHLRSFVHEIRWDSAERRIEMHLASRCNQTVCIRALDASFSFGAGETIWTESSHKFTEDELDSYARLSGFNAVATWVDQEWPFAEVLWRAI